jgi:hypothetical protein
MLFRASAYTGVANPIDGKNALPIRQRIFCEIMLASFFSLCYNSPGN